MGYLDAAMKKLEQMIVRRFDVAAPFRATVDSIDGTTGMVAIKRLDATTAETELRARVGLDSLAVGDEVLCLPVSGAPVIVGKVHRTDPPGLPFGGSGSADTVAHSDHVHTLVDKVLQPYAASSPSLSTGARLLTSVDVTLPDGVKCRIVARLRTTEKSDSGSAYFTLFLNIWNGTSSVVRTSEQIQCVAGVPNPATFEHTVVATGNGDAWPVSASVIYVSGGAIAVGAGELTVEVYPKR